MVDNNNTIKYNDNKGKRKHEDTKANPNKKYKVTCWKCQKPGHLKKDYKGGNVGNKANGSGTNGSVNGSSNSLKGHNMFNNSSQVYYVTYVPEVYFVQDDDVAWWVDSGATVHVYLRFSSGKIVSLFNVLHVPNIRKNLFSSSILNNCGYKQVVESNKFVLSKHAFMSTSKLYDSILWHARLRHVHFKRMQDMSKDVLIPAFDMDTEKYNTCMPNKITKKLFQNVKHETKVLELIHSDQCDLDTTPSLGNNKYFLTFIDDASRFFYLCLLQTKDEALDKFKVFKTKVELQQGSLIKRFKTDMGVACISTIRLLIALALIHNLIIHQMDVKITFLNCELHEEVYMNQPHRFIIPGTENKVNLTKEFFSLRFSIKDMGEAHVIFGIKIKHESNGIAISQSYYTEKVLKKFNYFDCTPMSTPMDTSEKLNGKLSSLTYTDYPSVLEGYTNASWISNTKENSSTYGWVFLLGGAASKEAEWLRNLILKIPLWSKPIASIYIRSDSASTLAKAYSQIYNEKYRHLDVRHSMIHELIMNGVISIEFVRSQQNLADHLTKELARDLVIKSVEGMGLESN
ncbi:zinc finger, CCHC-type containing protein [Tanacetum coccineum]|uniref:Zinc finger, CCHC-type containing protein n=1 Tax=Tanacetum coccineum TaxID=301880 RepID=A0ABQ5IQX1_9ASTR